MYTTLHCISLRSVRHSDSRIILSAWSRELGRVSIGLSATASREARRRRALTSPLSTFEAVCNPRPGQEIINVKDLMIMPGSLALNADPLKHFSAEFIAELLDTVLRSAPADDAISDFLFEAIGSFSAAPRRAIANFHLIIMSRLARCLGVAPDASTYFRGSVFDFIEGRFRLSEPLHHDYVDGSEARVAAMIARAELRHSALLPLGRNDRRRILHYLIHYYELHLCSLSGMRSLQILEDL